MMNLGPTVSEIDYRLSGLARIHEIENAEHIRRGTSAVKSTFLVALTVAIDSLLDRRSILARVNAQFGY